MLIICMTLGGNLRDAFAQDNIQSSIIPVSIPSDLSSLSSAELVDITTPIYRPKNIPYMAPPFGTYSYTISWQGIPAATVNFTCEPDGLYYKLHATAKTAKAISLFYNLRYNASAIISAVNLLPFKTDIELRENSKTKLVNITYNGLSDVMVTRSSSGADTKSMRFNPNNFMLEPFSAALIARTLDWDSTDIKEFDTFNGKSRYLIKLKSLGRENVWIGDGMKEAWIIVPEVINLVNLSQSKKLRQAKIYLSADQRREILKITSTVFIGNIVANLDSFKPYTGVSGELNAQTMHLAQADPVLSREQVGQ